MHTVGLIGAGYWGQNYLRIFSESPQCKLEWCADLDPSRLETVAQNYPSVKTTTDYTDLLSDGNIDAVCLATPPETHFDIASQFLQESIAVLVEKPLTIDSEHADELVTLSSHMNTVLMVGHIFEYHEGVRRLRSLYTEDELGKPYYLEAMRKGLGPIRSNVSALWDLAVHDVSIFRYIIDSPATRVKCIGQSFLQNVPDSVFLFLEFETGVYAHAHCSWLHPQKTRKVTIVGDERMAVFNDTNPDRVLQIYENTVNSHQPTGLDEFHYTVQEGDVYVPSIDVREPLKVQVEHFFECIETNQTPLTDGEEGSGVVRLLELAEQSLRDDGKWIEV